VARISLDPNELLVRSNRNYHYLSKHSQSDNRFLTAEACLQCQVSPCGIWGG